MIIRPPMNRGTRLRAFGQEMQCWSDRGWHVDTKDGGCSMNACQAARAANLLSIVANQSRLQMIKIMLKNDVSVGELANMTGLSSSATSQHLSLMKNMNILVQRRENTTQYCSINLLFADFFLRLILVTELQAAVFDASQPAAVP